MNKTKNPNFPSKNILDSLLKNYKNKEFNYVESQAILITKDYPNYSFGWKILGSVLKLNGKINESLAATLKSVELSPNDFEVHYNLANIYKEIGNLSDAVNCYKKSISLKSNYFQAFFNLANTYKELEILDEAIKSYQKAISIKPDYAKAYYNLATVFQELGKLDDAKKNYENAIFFNPNFVEAHRHLASIKVFYKKDEQFSKIIQIYNDNKTSKEELCHINFTLAKIYEDLKDYKSAFFHYTEGNMFKSKQINYNIENDQLIFKQIKSNYSKIKEFTLNISDNISIVPIFIVGMPRSGTSLIEQIISSHSSVTGGGELSFAAKFGASIARGVDLINSQKLIDFRNYYLNNIKRLSKGNYMVTDKAPLNFFYIGLILSSLPEAKIVNVNRNPAALCWANYKQFFLSKNLGYSYNIEDIKIYLSLYSDLMNFWNSIFKDKIYNLDYDKLTINQEKETYKLIKFLDLKWEDSCLKPQYNDRIVSTASNLQIRKEIYKYSSNDWHKYKPFLNGLLDNIN